MLFTPLHDRVLVRRIEEDEKTSGGLIIPETAKEKPGGCQPRFLISLLETGMERRTNQ